MPKGVLAPMGPHLTQVLNALPAFFGLPPIGDPAEVPAVAARLRGEGRPYVGLPLPPMVHGAALNIMALPALILGGTVVLAEKRHFDPHEAWDLVADERVGAMLIVGDAFARPLLQALRAGPARDLTSLRLISSTGAALSADAKTELLAQLADDAAIMEFIASTEAPMGSSISTKGRPVETGRFTPAPGVLVLDEDDLPLAPGSPTPGRLAVPTAAYGYLNDDAKTASTFPVIAGRRYAIPGDYALLDADGTIRLLGRGSTCINSGGLKIFPEEVEDVLKAHPGVDDAVVFGVPDDRFGESVAALISPGDAGITPDQILIDIRRTLAGFKVPRLLKVVAEVPRNNVGKPDYAAVRRVFAGLGDAAPLSETV
jgi:acyl-CoA synthetase (AMP-forming)/AMP-acid ligase II